jgi:hypothetical protein
MGFRLCLLMLSGTLVTACALGPTAPGFPVVLPDEIEADAKALAIVGDLQMTPLAVRKLMGRENNELQQKRLLEDITAHVGDLGALVVLGDLVFTSSSRSDWKHFDALVGPLSERVPVLPAIGNHDYRCVLVRFCVQGHVPRSFLSRFEWFAPGRPYWLGFGSAALLFLDTETRIYEQSQWLRSWLDRHEDEFAAVVVFTHRPPYTDSKMRDSRPSPEIQSSFVEPLRQASPIAVFFSGHAHGYEHLVVDGMHFIVSAGGGGPRGRLKPVRPLDTYVGRDCALEDDGSVLRPYNYQLLRVTEDALEIDVRGFCRHDDGVGRIERFRVPFSSE